ncbi:MAG TPA: hypothetical protein VGM06_21240 [Polyangiaceae bacterium]|jgi:hypothetical protein
MRGRVWAGWVRERTLLLVALLSLLLASSSALPSLLRFVADADAHTCACAKIPGHRTCSCPICERNADLRSHVPTLRGRCGEDAPAFGAGLAPAVAPAATLLPPVRRARSAMARALPAAPRSVFFTPPTPPPRSLPS